MYLFGFFHNCFLKKFYFEVSAYLYWKHKQFKLTIYWEKLILFCLLIIPFLQLMVIQLILDPKTTTNIQNIGLVSVSWVSRNIWRDWNQEYGRETRPVSWSRISTAATSARSHLIFVFSKLVLKIPPFCLFCTSFSCLWCSLFFQSWISRVW